jgi:hypothetical protein
MITRLPESRKTLSPEFSQTHLIAKETDHSLEAVDA